jgi:hypothetical protein
MSITNKEGKSLRDQIQGKIQAAYGLNSAVKAAVTEEEQKLQAEAVLAGEKQLTEVQDEVVEELRRHPGDHMYGTPHWFGDTVPKHVIKKRRTRNRAARKSRMINRRRGK